MLAIFVGFIFDFICGLFNKGKRDISISGEGPFPPPSLFSRSPRIFCKGLLVDDDPVCGAEIAAAGAWLRFKIDIRHNSDKTLIRLSEPVPSLAIVSTILVMECNSDLSGISLGI
jgi:hypothetical protein